MKMNRRTALTLLAAAGQAAASKKLHAMLPADPANPTGRVATSAERGIAEGPFQPTWDSLKADYKAPDWFRDAKFGIWAHWSAQCVPGAGRLVRPPDVHPGQRQNYDYHVQHLRPSLRSSASWRSTTSGRPRNGSRRS